MAKLPLSGQFSDFIIAYSGRKVKIFGAGLIFQKHSQLTNFQKQIIIINSE
ncbi:MAG: hypothetical protein IJJ69_02705 [Oscillospiraceae bacterium]|nr:hypothetical protein [Oscillospiraceae bacterium]